MNEDQLRALVRDAIARHVPRGAAPGGPADASFAGTTSPRHALEVTGVSGPVLAPSSPVTAYAPGGVAIAAGPGAVVQVHLTHISHALFAVPSPGGDGPCLIEPGVGWNHCGFCQTYGH
jgi:hypothetical protein